MIEITVVGAAKLLWQVVARIPWIRLLLRRRFPLPKCRTMFRVSVSGPQAGFELMQMRPMPALRGVTIEIYNPLPFAVSFEAHQAIVSIDSAIVMEPVLNSLCKVPATGFAILSLPGLPLAEREVGRVSDNCCRIQIELRWRCSSGIHEWQDQKSYEFMVYVRKDKPPKNKPAGLPMRNEDHIAYLFTADLQFRLASAVRIATTMGVQPLDLPSIWTHGQHSVGYEEIVLRSDQADYAACFLHRSATYLMVVAMSTAIKQMVPDARNSTNPSVRAAYQIARAIRNAFAHAPVAPRWVLDDDCKEKIFEVPDVIKLDTTGLQGVALDWRHYGGPLALLKLCRFVRFEILKDEVRPRRAVPAPTSEIYQVGEVMLVKVDELPPGCTLIDPLSDGTLDLGNGFTIKAE